MCYETRHTKGIYKKMDLHARCEQDTQQLRVLLYNQWTQYRPEFYYKALKQRKQIHWWTTSPSALVTAAENILLNPCSRPLESYGCAACLVTDAPNLSSGASRTSRKQELSVRICISISNRIQFKRQMDNYTA